MLKALLKALMRKSIDVTNSSPLQISQAQPPHVHKCRLQQRFGCRDQYQPETFVGVVWMGALVQSGCGVNACCDHTKWLLSHQSLCSCVDVRPATREYVHAFSKAPCLYWRCFQSGLDPLKRAQLQACNLPGDIRIDTKPMLHTEQFWPLRNCIHLELIVQAVQMFSVCRPIELRLLVRNADQVHLPAAALDQM